MKSYIVAIALFIILIFLLFTIFSLKPLIVLSSSMSPLLRVGDLAIAKPTKSQLEVGDVITFKDPAGRENVLITHRIVNITDRGLKTKGDAVEEPDPFIVKPENVFGKVVFDIPYLGYFLVWSKKKEAFFILILLPSILIISEELIKIRTYINPLLEARARKREKRKKEKNKINIICYHRMFTIFLIAFAAFSFLSLPYMLESGYQIKEEKIDASLVPASLIIKRKGNSFPHYKLVALNSSYTVQNAQFLSVAPGFCVYWHKLLAFNPLFPALVYTIFPPLLITLLTIPLWKRPIYRKRIRR